MPFNVRDSVLVVPRRTTGQIEGGTDTPEHYDVMEDVKNTIQRHHEGALFLLPYTKTMASDHYTVKLKGWIARGERCLQIAIHLGGYGEPLRGRYHKEVHRFKIS